jgi:phosphatidylglycerol---prolipoprotein diacylglyceryl transferase
LIPLLVEIGPLPVYSFGLTIAVAFVFGTLRLTYSFEQFGIPPHLAERYVMWAGISGLVGARIWFILENLSELSGDLLSALFANAGFTFYGGFIIAALVLIVRAKRDGVPLLTFADALGPTLALGYAVGRLGCQLSGDGDYGIPTTGFFGMAFEDGTVPTPPGVKVFPTPLFESAFAFLLVWILSVVERKEGGFFARPGMRFGLYLVLLSFERFWVETLRPNQLLIGSFSEAQCVAIGLSLVGATMMVVARRDAPVSG